MKLSQNTLQVLKNFSQINAGMVIQGGNTLRTMAVARNIVAQAEIEEELPECAFYNLPEFLNVISLFKDAELDFTEKYVDVGSGRSKVRYFYSDPTVIVAPTKDINPPPMEINFNISQESLQELIKSSSVLQLPDIVVECDGETMAIGARDLKNPSSNKFSQEIDSVDGGIDKQFMMVFKAENLQKLRPGSYKVEISQRKISRWTCEPNNKTGESNKMTYYVSLESTSKFDG